jgi:hypothetical protein
MNGIVPNSNGIEHCVMNYFGSGSDMGCLELIQPKDRVEQAKADAEAGRQAYFDSIFQKYEEAKQAESEDPRPRVDRPYGFFP